MSDMLHSLTLAFGYVPLRDPLPVADYWMWLLLPLVVVIAIVYKTIRIDDLRDLPRHVLSMSVQIIAFMAVAAAVLWALTELV